MPKPILNMFLPIMFIGHTHSNGAIVLQNQNQQANVSQTIQQANLDYEKHLLDSYVPYLTFFDWLCRNTFSRHLTLLNPANEINNSSSASSSSSNTTTSSSSSSSSSPTVLQTTKQIIDLILIVSQQSFLLNVSFISYLNNYLASLLSAGADSVQQETSNETRAANSEFYQLILKSTHLHSFLNTVLNDFRYLINKKEIYEFIQLMLPSFMLALKNERIKLSSPPKTMSHLVKFKSYIERCCQSINEIRFYFEFQQLSKHLLKLTAFEETATFNAASTSTTSAAASGTKCAKLGAAAPLNITTNIDLKSSQILGSIKAIYLLIASTMHAESGMQTPAASTIRDSDEYNMFKFKFELKKFLVEIVDYLRLQMAEMSTFIGANGTDANEATETEQTDMKTQQSNESFIGELNFQ